MTYKEARELALRAMAQREEGSEQRWATFGETLDAALSAFSAAGWELVPTSPTPNMIKEGAASSFANCSDYTDVSSEQNALEIWLVMQAVAIEERT